MISIKDKADCCGCTACESICNHHAITMQSDVMGFYYPQVDTSKCVDCGLCEKVCPFHSMHDVHSSSPIAYLMRHKDSNELSKSKSGAAFVVLSDFILKSGGAVYGARLNSKHLVEHSAADDKEGRDSFRGSKYIQSNLKQVFPEIKEKLRNNHIVLFSGTPCQVAGLKSYIGSQLSRNLYLIDILCHGVASPAVWSDYIGQIEAKKGKKIKYCIPRNPKYGWDHNIDSFFFDGGGQFDSDFFTGYVYHKWITQRWSCNKCPFTSLNRVSDITLGDAWGINKVAPELDNDNMGCSLVLINTEKGKILYDSISKNCVSKAIDINQMLQPVLLHPTALHPLRQKFEDEYMAKGFKYVRRKYLDNRLVVIKSKIRTFLSKIKHLIIR